MKSFIQIFIPFLFISFLTSCVGPGKSTQRDQIKKPKPERESLLKKYSTKKIFEILDQSKIKYEVIQADSSHYQKLIQVYHSKSGANPLWYVETSPDGNTSLREYSLEGKEGELFHKCEDYFQNKELDEAVGCYQKLIHLYPKNFKGFSNLGDAYFLKGTLDSAEIFFKKAIDVNPLDYQAYFFLADTYELAGRGNEALEMITYAYMLNHTSGPVYMATKRILKQQGFRLREERFLMPGGYEIVNPNFAKIYLPLEENTAWTPFILCLACWAMEPELKENVTPEDHLDLLQYENCLINFTLAVASQLEENKPVSDNAKMIYEAMVGGHRNSILHWEIASVNAPGIIYLMPAEQRKVFIEYIKTFVFEKI